MDTRGKGERTAGPWTVGATFQDFEVSGLWLTHVIEGEAPSIAADAIGHTPAQARERAAYIVEACNGRDALLARVAVLEAALRDISREAAFWPTSDAAGTLERMANAALASSGAGKDGAA